MSDKLLEDSLGYFLAQEDEVMKFCEAEKERTGHLHTWEPIPGQEGKVEIKVHLPERYLTNHEPMKADEYTTVYFNNGFRVVIKTKDAAVAIQEATADKEDGTPSKTPLRKLALTVPGLDRTYNWMRKEQRWEPGSTLQTW